MAIRSGAGTGVVVAVVVLVVVSIFLLILSIVFYTGKADAIEARAKAEEQLVRYASNTQRGSDPFKRMEEAASSEGESVAGYLNREMQNLLAYVGGASARSITEVKADLSRFGVSEQGTIRSTLEQTTRDMNGLQDELESLKSNLAARETELAEKDAQIERLRQEQEESIASLSEQLETYRTAVETYGTDVQETIASLEEAKNQHRQQYEDVISDLEDQLDERGQEMVVLKARVDEYEEILSHLRLRATNPALLVDANVIEVEPADNLVYIDRGRRDRIVRGMTFEIYDDASAIQIDPRTNELPRGKASVMVTKVGETTSTGKITRQVPGRPVIRNNVLANAIYDPGRTFKFLIHGRFDVDGDGRPSEAEADYLKSLVLDWGGEVYEGEGVPGDLDFLVLGAQPPDPLRLPPNAPQHQLEFYMSQRQARLEYDRLADSARDAQIPLLNQNRFLILIGHTDR